MDRHRREESLVSLKLVVSRDGTVSIPREALDLIGVKGQGFVRMAAVGGQVVITRIPVRVVAPEQK